MSQIGLDPKPGASDGSVDGEQFAQPGIAEIDAFLLKALGKTPRTFQRYEQVVREAAPLPEGWQANDAESGRLNMYVHYLPEAYRAAVRFMIDLAEVEDTTLAKTVYTANRALWDLLSGEEAAGEEVTSLLDRKPVSADLIYDTVLKKMEADHHVERANEERRSRVQHRRQRVAQARRRAEEQEIKARERREVENSRVYTGAERWVQPPLGGGRSKELAFFSRPPKPEKEAVTKIPRQQGILDLDAQPPEPIVYTGAEYWVQPSLLNYKAKSLAQINRTPEPKENKPVRILKSQHVLDLEFISEQPTVFTGAELWVQPSLFAEKSIELALMRAHPEAEQETPFKVPRRQKVLDLEFIVPAEPESSTEAAIDSIGSLNRLAQMCPREFYQL